METRDRGRFELFDELVSVVKFYILKMTRREEDLPPDLIAIGPVERGNYYLNKENVR